MASTTEYMQKWREEKRDHYNEYQKEYKRAYRAKKKLEAMKTNSNYDELNVVENNEKLESDPK